MANGKGVLGYVPTKWIAALGLAIYALISCALIYRYIRGPKPRKWMLWLTGGSVCMTAGFGLRIAWGVGSNVDSVGLYAVQNLFLLLSPCAFLANDYMILPRLATFLSSEDCLFLRSRWIVRIFITSDVLTFLLQGAGGGIAASSDGDKDKSHMGDILTMAGLILQVVSFSLFTLLTILFGMRVKSRYSEKWTNRFPSPSGITRVTRLQDWRSLYLIVLLTCIAFLVRCVFRVAEFAGGYDSYLASHEGYFYLLDALPLALAVVLFAFVWPPEVFQNGPWTVTRSDNIYPPKYGQEQEQGYSQGYAQGPYGGYPPQQTAYYPLEAQGSRQPLRAGY